MGHLRAPDFLIHEIVVPAYIPVQAGRLFCRLHFRTDQRPSQHAPDFRLLKTHLPPADQIAGSAVLRYPWRRYRHKKNDTQIVFQTVVGSVRLCTFDPAYIISVYTDTVTVCPLRILGVKSIRKMKSNAIVLLCTPKNILHIPGWRNPRIAGDPHVQVGDQIRQHEPFDCVFYCRHIIERDFDQAPWHSFAKTLQDFRRLLWFLCNRPMCGCGFLMSCRKRQSEKAWKKFPFLLSGLRFCLSGNSFCESVCEWLA